MNPIQLQDFLIVSAILFSLGIIAILTRKNAIGILMGIELILNAANLNLVAFSHYITNELSGQIFVIFIVLLAAIEAIVALAIILAIYRHFDTIEIDKIDQLKG
ncbi:MAG: NADH-quinone oxidoreductase subunit K [Candidatus Fischerbacteria bacterium RBG_13_37_8]|uniref:NADH-quinone oxidoreductase subunit K n=1 Tax=Candidatus Fischerbacteria bacterium RBG_13_37_8 TaxID=1817863 RepID=A0A1F5VR08_9BACT|nr:MAG: NADH-quinone oxidoreductase subunit K [Candidatus Fischerbacteria bacterium RBG_13_37_8]